MKMNKLVLAGLCASAVACNQKPEVVEVDPNVGFELSSLDSSYAACDDFFHFTAQGWLDKNPIPEAESSWGKFSALSKNNQVRVRELFDGLLSSTESPAKGTDAQLVGDLYRSGMDSLRIENLGFSPIEGLVNDFAGVQSVEEWMEVAIANETKGVSMPFGVYVGADDKNASMNALHVYQSGIGLPDQAYYVREDSTSKYIQEKYIAHIARMFNMYGMENSDAIAADVYAFEKKLAEKMMDRVARRDPANTYNKMTVAELDEMTPNMSFAQYLSANGLSTDEVIVTSPDYIKFIGEDIANWNPKTLSYFSIWKVIDGFANQLHHEAVQANFDFFSTVLSGVSEMQPRWRRVQGGMNGLSEQIGHLYVDEYFPAEHKAQIEGMVEDLRSAFRVRIENSTWMSGETKAKAIEKLQAFTYKIGYPDSWKDYSDLDIRADDYVGNSIRMVEYLTAENYAKLGKPVDKSEWHMGAHIVNAYYNPSNNEVVFPAGILQPPFYMPEADAALNYGAIGGVIGHEFTHGFDDQGSKYDKDGNLVDWWTPEDRARFEELTSSVVNLYSSYEALPGEFVNGQQTLGENIADLGGLTLAYHAYLKHMEGKEEPATIGGFTDDQRVFLGWAQVWQVHYTEEALRYRLNNDYHSPGEFRVIGPMSNMPEFWEAYGCGNGTPMHLSDSAHAVIW